MHKKILILLLLPCLLGLRAPAQVTVAENQLETADRLYLDGKFADARDQYLQIVNSGFQSANLYYNLGNAFYKTGQIPYAVLFYERALLLNPRDEDIQFNLDQANRMIVDRINPVNEFFVLRWIRSASSALGRSGWAVVSLVAFAFLCITIVYLYAHRSEHFRQLFFSLGILLLLIWITSVSLTVVQNRRLHHGNYAVVFAPSITAKSSPDPNGTDLFVLHEGLKIKITDQVGTWIRIRLPDGNEAWIPATTVEKI